MVVERKSVVGKRIFVGIDVHKKMYVLCVLVEGQVPIKMSVAADPKAVAQRLKKTYKGALLECAYEAGFAGFTLHRELTAAGIKSLVVNAASIPIASNDRVKTDKRDALKLATLLSKGDLKGIYVPSPEEELKRLLPRTRQQLIEERSRIGNRIKSKLFLFGLIDLNDDRVMSLARLKEIQNLKLAPELARAIAADATIYRALHDEIRAIENEMQKQAEKDENIERIMRSVPGVGLISSRVITSELADINRFNNERQIFSYSGLTPSENSSGDKIRRGEITRQGNTRLRHVLIEVAWRAIRKDTALRKKYERLKIRTGGRKAIVAIARVLLGRIRACLKEEQCYKLRKAA